MTYRLYVLFDVREPHHTRYVGVTSKSIKKRRLQHFNEASLTNKRTHKLHWIRTLQLEHLSIRELLRATRQDVLSYEVKLIALLREIGHSLTNSTDGGDGIINLTGEGRERLAVWKGRNFSPEHREKLRALHTGLKRSIETRQAISRALKGKRKSASHCLNMRKSARDRQPISEEALLRRNASIKAAWARRKNATCVWKIRTIDTTNL